MNKLGLVIDYKKLNECTIPDRYPMQPIGNSILFGKSKIFFNNRNFQGAMDDILREQILKTFLCLHGRHYNILKLD